MACLRVIFCWTRANVFLGHFELVYEKNRVDFRLLAQHGDVHLNVNLSSNGK